MKTARTIDGRITDREAKKHMLFPGKQPGFRLIQHPRRFNKPLSCQSGMHKGLTNRVIQGVLCLYCTKCGMHVGQGIHDKTWSRQDIHRIKKALVGKGRPNTKEETMKASWEAMEILRRRFTDKEINRMIRRRTFEKRGYRV